MWLASTSLASVGREATDARLQPLEHSRGFEDLRAGANSIWQLQAATTSPLVSITESSL
jgi:hypothetical protein